MLGVLAAASEDPPLPGTGPPVHFLDGNLKGYAAQVLAALDGHLPADVMDGVLHGLARSEQVTAFPMTSAALRLAFPGGAPDPLPAFGELTELQQRVVCILTELPGAMTIRAGHGADSSVLKPDAPTVMLTKGSR